MSWLSDFLYSILGGLSNVLTAVVLLVVAFVVALIVKVIVLKIIKSSKIQDKLATKNIDVKNTVDMIGKFVFVIVFLLFIPDVLSLLGLSSAASPIQMVLSSFIGYLPNIIAAIIIIMFGSYIAKLIMQIVTALLKKTKIDSLQEKYGVEVKPGFVISDILGKIIYTFILVIVVVAALQVLNISVISVPALSVINTIFGLVPNICAAIVLVLIGMFLANLAFKLLESVLAGTGIDKTITTILPEKNSCKPSYVIAYAAKVIIDIVFIVEAIKVINLSFLSSIGTTVIAYLPAVIGAILIITVALLVANWSTAAILKKNGHATVMANVAKIAILVVAGFMVLSQLGIAPSIVNAAFELTLAGAALAFALAFGLGGKEVAKRILERFEKKIDK